jgi:hypothetical protein
MGWCPKFDTIVQYKINEKYGVDRIVFVLSIGISVFFLTFLLFQQFQIVKYDIQHAYVENSNPILVVHEDQLYLYVKSRLRVMDSYINYRARIDLSGHVIENERILIEDNIGHILLPRYGV